MQYSRLLHVSVRKSTEHREAHLGIGEMAKHQLWKGKNNNEAIITSQIEKIVTNMDAQQTHSSSHLLSTRNLIKKKEICLKTNFT